MKDDVISRQQAIDALECQIKQCNKALSNFGISMIDEYAVKVERASLVAYEEQLKCLPSVQPERKTGRWIGKYPVTSACSECNYLIHDSKVKVFAYCPNCGAHMKGVTTT